MQVAPIVLIGTLVYAFTNFVKYLTSKDWNSAVTQLLVWGLGIIAVFIAAHAQVVEGLKFNGVAFSNLQWGSEVLLGLLASSLFTSFYDVKRAIDNHDTAATPALLGSARGAGTPPAGQLTIGPPGPPGPAGLTGPAGPSSDRLSSTQATEVNDIVRAHLAQHEAGHHDVHAPLPSGSVLPPPIAPGRRKAAPKSAGRRTGGSAESTAVAPPEAEPHP